MTDISPVSVDNLPLDSALTDVLGNRTYQDGISQTVRVPVAGLASLLAPYGTVVSFGTKAQMDAALTYPENTGAYVWADSTVANTGVYRKTGASGSGSWTRVADLPAAVIMASNAGAGTANALVATSAMPVAEGSLVRVNVTATNTVSPATVSFNGAAALTIKTNAGNNVSVGGLVSGSWLLGIRTGTSFRLVSDQASAAIQAAAEAARDTAEDLRDDTQAIKDAAVSETTAIKDLAVSAADTAASVGGSGIADYATRDLAAAITIPAGRTYINVTGVATVSTAPTHRYKREGATEPDCPINFKDDDDEWFVIDNPYLLTSIAGAKGDNNPASAAANRVAIQQVIDTYTYANAWGISPMREPTLGNGTHYIDETLHVGWGETFLKSVLLGVGSTYVGATAGSTIKVEFSDAPAINVQGGRRSVVGGFAIVGPNKDDIDERAFGRWAPDGDDTDIANWPGLSMAATFNSRYAPSAGVAIDGYSGTAPTPAYPTYTVPDHLTLPSQYSRAPSSEVELYDLDITGLGVGCVVHPSGSDGNGDFVNFRNIRVAQCVVGFSFCQTQARNMTLLRPSVSDCHTAFTNNLHGKLTGRIGEIFDAHVGNTINIIRASATSFSGPINFRGLYSELCWRVGDITGTSSNEESLTFDRSHVAIDAQNIAQQTLGAGTPEKGVPAICLAANGSVTVEHIAGSVTGYHAVYVISGASNNVTVAGTRLQRSGPVSSLYEKIAHTALCGGLVVHNFGSGRLKAEPTIQPKFTAYDAVSGADLGQAYPRRVWLGSRRRPTPIYYQSHAGNVDFANQGDTVLCAPRVSFVSVVASSPGAFSCTVSYSGLTGTLTFGAGRTEAMFAYLGPHTGDAIYDQGTGTTMYVSGRSGSTVTAEIQNNFRDIGAGPVARTTWPTTGSTLYIANSRLFTTSDLYFGTFSAGSAIITNVERWDRNCFIESEIAVGDYLNTPFELGLVSDRPRGFVTARSNSGKTITLADAVSTSKERVPLGNWFAFY